MLLPKRKESWTLLTVFLVCCLGLALLAAGPFIVIWCLNALLGLGVPYTLKTVFASFILIVFFGRGSN